MEISDKRMRPGRWGRQLKGCQEQEAKEARRENATMHANRNRRKRGCLWSGLACLVRGFRWGDSHFSSRIGRPRANGWDRRMGGIARGTTGKRGERLTNRKRSRNRGRLRQANDDMKNGWPAQGERCVAGDTSTRARGRDQG